MASHPCLFRHHISRRHRLRARIIIISITLITYFITAITRPRLQSQMVPVPAADATITGATDRSEYVTEAWKWFWTTDRRPVVIRSMRRDRGPAPGATGIVVFVDPSFTKHHYLWKCTHLTSWHDVKLMYICTNFVSVLEMSVTQGV